MHVHKNENATQHTTDAHSAHAEMYPGLGSNATALVNASFVLTTIGQFMLLVLGATLLLSNNIHNRSIVLGNLLIVTFASTVAPYLLYVLSRRYKRLHTHHTFSTC